jgi:hypothetical protein
VATATAFPTVVSARPQFAVLPFEPYMLALDAALPGVARPNEMWLDVPSPTREAEVRSALGLSPFRFPAVTSRADLVAAQSGDPLSQAIVWALIAAALAGLVLSVGGVLLGTITDLRDERGELADLEAQGLPPSTLRWHALAKTTWLTAGGVLAGILVGVALTAGVTSALAIGATGAEPIPPLAIVIPVLPLFLLGTGLLVLVLGLVAGLARRAYAARTLGERRALEPDVLAGSPAWRIETGAHDG